MTVQPCQNFPQWKVSSVLHCIMHRATNYKINEYKYVFKNYNPNEMHVHVTRFLSQAACWSPLFYEDNNSLKLAMTIQLYQHDQKYVIYYTVQSELCGTCIMHLATSEIHAHVHVTLSFVFFDRRRAGVLMVELCCLQQNLNQSYTLLHFPPALMIRAL